MGATAFRRNAELARQGRPVARVPRPQNISWNEHSREIQDLTRKYELQLLDLRNSDTVIASLDEAQAESKRLAGEMAALQALLDEAAAADTSRAAASDKPKTKAKPTK